MNFDQAIIFVTGNTAYITRDQQPPRKHTHITPASQKRLVDYMILYGDPLLHTDRSLPTIACSISAPPPQQPSVYQLGRGWADNQGEFNGYRWGLFNRGDAVYRDNSTVLYFVEMAPTIVILRPPAVDEPGY